MLNTYQDEPGCSGLTCQVSMHFRQVFLTLQASLPKFTVHLTTFLGSSEKVFMGNMKPTSWVILIIRTGIPVSRRDAYMPILGTSTMINDFTIRREKAIAAFLGSYKEMLCVPTFPFRRIDQIICTSVGTARNNRYVPLHLGAIRIRGLGGAWWNSLPIFSCRCLIRSCCFRCSYRLSCCCLRESHSWSCLRSTWWSILCTRANTLSLTTAIILAIKQKNIVLQEYIRVCITLYTV